MNCSSCQQQVNAYIAGQLPEDVQEQVATHLKTCKHCTRAYNSLLLTEKVIESESKARVNPFLSTRVMAQIESNEVINADLQSAFSFRSVLQPILVAVLIAIAITIGIRVGNTYSNQIYAASDIPQELLYMNDAAMESIEVLISE